MAALERLRAAATPRLPTDPKPLPYLHSIADQNQGNLNVKLEVLISTETMRRNKLDAYLLSESNAEDLYWTPAQLIAHHTSNGCNLAVGDVLATGTISGPAESSAGRLPDLPLNAPHSILLPPRASP